MQQAEAADSSHRYTGSPGKGYENTGQDRKTVRLVDPFDEIAEVTCGQEIIGSLLSLALTEVEDHEAGRYVTIYEKSPLKRLRHLLIAIDTLHDLEMERIVRAEDTLFAMGIPAMIQTRRAA